MKRLDKPIIYHVPFSKKGIEELRNLKGQNERKLLLQFPTVYLIYSSRDIKEVSAYVGETSDIQRRTIEHLDEDPLTREDWLDLSNQSNSRMIVIGHNHFNKSLTLDIENKMMLYLSGIQEVQHLNNRRTNPQNEYYTESDRDFIFSMAWKQLHLINPQIFPIEKAIQDSALFKASPFHKLTEDQLNAKSNIFQKVISTLGNNQQNNLVFICGEAGAGKTVLLSSLFYDLITSINKNGAPLNNLADYLDAYLLVNHDQQLKVYQEIMLKLGIINEKSNRVTKPTKFINEHKNKKPVDLILVDEAHLLWTQGKQAYRGQNQLDDLKKMARVVIAVFDSRQILTTASYWENSKIDKVLKAARKDNDLITLHNQLRIQADQKTIAWINDFVNKHQINPLPKNDSKNYQIKIFKDPKEMNQEIKIKAKDQRQGLSRMLATFDWPYINNKKPADDQYWRVKINDWSLPWNLQLKPATHKQKILNKHLAWAEQPQTIDEVGSTFTIQGFDLNYAAVIIGPSVKYRNHQVIFDETASFNKHATQKRTFEDKSKNNVAKELLQNEINVLLTRGVHGLFIYAVDPQLREKLLALKNE